MRVEARAPADSPPPALFPVGPPPTVPSPHPHHLNPHRSPPPPHPHPPPSPPAWARGLQLKSLGALAARQDQRPLWPTGHPGLDHDLGGGLLEGTVTECSGPATATLGLTGLQHRLLLRARETRIFTALIDAFDRFDPGGCPTPLRSSLLWIRGQGAVLQALKAADLLVRDPNFRLLLLDLREAETRALRRVPAQQWYRLQRAVRESDSLLVAFTPVPTIVSASTRLRFHAAPGQSTAANGLHSWEILRHGAHAPAAPAQAAAM